AAASAKPAGSGAASAKPAASASAAAKPAASGTTNVKVGASWSSFTQMPFLYAIEKGYFAKQGISMEQVTIQSDQTIPPLSTNQIQVGATGFGVSLYNAAQRDIPVLMTADNGSATGTSSGAIVIRKALAGQIKDYKDLKGRKIALSSAGTSIHVTLGKALAAGGLTFKDIDLVTIPFGDMPAALTNGAVDAALLTEPAISKGVADGSQAVFKWSDEIYPNQQFNAVMYSPQFAKTATAQAFMTAYMQGVRDYNDVIRGKANLDEFARIGAKYLPVKDPAIYKSVRQIGINPDGKLQLGPMQEDIDFYISQGLMKDKPDLTKLVDNSFVDAALKELRPYKG
ncbi:MAG: ABC transporter substrate-binding protein, partial [Chloroflexota bacterium]